MTKILVTGGAGYVGSHTVLQLLENSFEVYVIDNMVNATKGVSYKPESLCRIEKLTKRSTDFEEIDLLDCDKLRDYFKRKGPFYCVIHFAALKAVGESCKIPLKYYKNNGTGSINLLEIMAEFGVKKIVFSSSATVYGDPKYLPIDEKHPVGNCTNPYGKTKLMMEEIMHDLCLSDPEWSSIMLRYFNPVGAHPSGEIGENPLGIPNNLMPYVAQVAVGKRPFLQIFGNDYTTPDGTGVRDYIHVMDLAVGHVSAVRKFSDPTTSGWKAYNLGTGNGNSVLEMVKAFEKASGKPIKYEICPRRDGDVGSSFADCSLAQNELGFKAEKSIHDMCSDAWRWQSKYPNGFEITNSKF